MGLWRYCLNLFPDIAGKVQHWNTNDGDGLDAEDAMALSRLLEETLEDGTARDYQRGFAEYLANIPDTNCYRCNGDGQVRGFVELTHPAQADDPECRFCPKDFFLNPTGWSGWSGDRRAGREPRRRVFGHARSGRVGRGWSWRGSPLVLVGAESANGGDVMAQLGYKFGG